MARTWIDDAFLSAYIMDDINGKETLLLRFFGREYSIRPIAPNTVGKCGFMLSLYQLLIAKRLPPNPTFHDEFKRIKTIPLLQLFLGSIVEREVEWEDHAYDIRLNNIDYHIRKVLRYSAFKNTERWFSIKDSRKFVYYISSDGEVGLPDYSFRMSEWGNREPTPYEILAGARRVAQLAMDLNESVSTRVDEDRKNEQ